MVQYSTEYSVLTYSIVHNQQANGVHSGRVPGLHYLPQTIMAMLQVLGFVVSCTSYCKLMRLCTVFTEWSTLSVTSWPSQHNLAIANSWLQAVTGDAFPCPFMHNVCNMCLLHLTPWQKFALNGPASLARAQRLGLFGGSPSPSDVFCSSPVTAVK